MKPDWSVLMIPTNFEGKERATSFFQVNPFSQLTAGKTACMHATDFPPHFDLRQAGRAFAAGVPTRAQSGGNGVWRSGSSSLYMSCSNSRAVMCPPPIIVSRSWSKFERIRLAPTDRPDSISCRASAPTLSSPSARNRAKSKRPKRRSTPL